MNLNLTTSDKRHSNQQINFSMTSKTDDKDSAKYISQRDIETKDTSDIKEFASAKSDYNLDMNQNNNKDKVDCESTPSNSVNNVYNTSNTTIQSRSQINNNNKMFSPNNNKIISIPIKDKKKE